MMAYDDVMAERVRDLIAPMVPFEERTMFGGLAFMVNTHMACGIVKDDLMVRVGRAGHDSALARGAREMDFTGRPMRGMVMVPGTDVRQDADLKESFTSNHSASESRSIGWPVTSAMSS